MQRPQERIRFRGSGDFARLLNHRAEAVLRDQVAMRRAYRVVWAKSALVLSWAIGSYLVLLLVADRPATVVAASTSLGLAAAAIGFCIMHDANHGGYSRSRKVNRLAAHSLDLIGGSSYVWAAKHLAHHTYTNVADQDPDIDALPFARCCTACATIEADGPAVNLNVGRAPGFNDELSGLGASRSDLHAAGTPAGGTAYGGLAGTNLGHGEPQNAPLESIAGSGNFEVDDDRRETEPQSGRTGGAVQGTSASKRGGPRKAARRSRRG